MDSNQLLQPRPQNESGSSDDETEEEDTTQNEPTTVARKPTRRKRKKKRKKPKDNVAPNSVSHNNPEINLLESEYGAVGGSPAPLVERDVVSCDNDRVLNDQDISHLQISVVNRSVVNSHATQGILSHSGFSNVILSDGTYDAYYRQLFYINHPRANSVRYVLNHTGFWPPAGSSKLYLTAVGSYNQGTYVPWEYQRYCGRNRFYREASFSGLPMFRNPTGVTLRPPVFHGLNLGQGIPAREAFPLGVQGQPVRSRYSLLSQPHRMQRGTNLRFPSQSPTSLSTTNVRRLLPSESDKSYVGLWVEEDTKTKFGDALPQSDSQDEQLCDISSLNIRSELNPDASPWEPDNFKDENKG